MSTQGWIFVVGFRVFDVGLLVAWLIWFFRLRDDEDDPPDEGGGGGGPRPGRRPEGPGGGGGLLWPRGRLAASDGRLRDGHRIRRTGRRRGGEALPRPLPARVRQPDSPAPTHRRG